MSEIDQGLHAPTKIPKDIKMIKEDAAPPTSVGVAGMAGMGSGSGGGVAGMTGLGAGHSSSGRRRGLPKPTGPQRVSSGVVQGLAISQPQPVYPPIAKAAHVQGVVVLHALISKQGTIEDLKVISGPPMLTGAAVDAVKRWRYKPYLLSGDPTEVETTINVNFTFPAASHTQFSQLFSRSSSSQPGKWICVSGFVGRSMLTLLIDPVQRFINQEERFQ